MNKIWICTSIIIGLVFLLTCCSSLISIRKTGTIKDIDGNIYKTITIGTQVWMAEDLKVTKYRNGDTIPNVTDNNQWNNLKSGAYCDYDNDVNNASVYGRIYNWYAVIDKRNIAPSGWHVPHDDEWQILIDYLGGNEIAGGKMKETDTIHWKSQNTGATNKSGFSALPGGFRYYDGEFKYIGELSIWWSRTYHKYSVLTHLLSYTNPTIGRYLKDVEYGLYIRCVKD